MNLNLREWAAINRFSKISKRPGDKAKAAKKIALKHYRNLSIENKREFLTNLEEFNKGS